MVFVFTTLDVGAEGLQTATGGAAPCVLSCPLATIVVNVLCSGVYIRLSHMLQ